MRYNIRALREKSGMTQEELARKSGVTRATIWKLETKDDEITTTKTLSRIAEALMVPMNDLFFTSQV